MNEIVAQRHTTDRTRFRLSFHTTGRATTVLGLNRSHPKDQDLSLLHLAFKPAPPLHLPRYILGLTRIIYALKPELNCEQPSRRSKATGRARCDVGVVGLGAAHCTARSTSNRHGLVQAHAVFTAAALEP